MKTRKPIFESEKPLIVKNLESAFKNALWDADRPFDVNDNDMYLMFDAINDGLFQNKLGRDIPKFTLKAELIPTGPRRYRGLEHALAAFTTGCCRGVQNELIIVRHPRGANFYVAVCALMHEMIHMFDFHFGPMGRQLDKYGTISMYDFNFPFMDPDTGRTMPPGANANIMNAARAKFRDFHQLPNELVDKIKDPSKNDGRPRQYQFPAAPARPGTDPDTGELVPQSEPLLKKYAMDDLDGFYDVHGDFFMGIANMVNRYGFGITDVFTRDTPTRMTKTYESETPPANPAEALCRFLKSDEHKGFDYRNEDNWFVEFS